MQGFPPHPSDIPPEVIPIVQSFFATIAVIALGIPAIRIIARRWERTPSPAATPVDITTRLERIEQAVEAVAIEVERIAEAQRFSARLAAEQQSSQPKISSSAD